MVALALVGLVSWEAFELLLILARATHGLPLDLAPARQHLDSVERTAFLEVTRTLMDSPDRHGAYVHQARFEAAPHAFGYSPRHERVEGRPASVEELPALLQRMEPVEVLVSARAVTMTWYEHGHGFGYDLIRLRVPDGPRAATLRRDDGSFQTNVQLEPRLWSHFPYH